MVRFILFSLMVWVCVMCIACGMILGAWGIWAGSVLMIGLGVFGLGSVNQIIFSRLRSETV